MAHAADVTTIIVIFLVATLKGILWLLPWEPEAWRLRLSLSLYSFTFAALWGMALLSIIGLRAGPGPEWFNWVLRVLLILFGSGSIFELLRAARRRGRS
jgi:hypothetical protein